ncbi:MAG: hypothetical protein B7X41_10460, partial [Microbacterium sp. 14-71-5]
MQGSAMRRRKLALPVAALAVLAVVAGVLVWLLPGRAAAKLVGPSSPRVAQAEAARAVSGARTVAVTLTAAATTADIGGRTVQTWAFNDTVPGPTIRLTAGDVVRATVVNRLPEPLTVHWHGIALRNDMDGVPDVTQAPIAPGGTFTYEFTAATAGTYFYHSHVGTQLDRGLYGPLVVDDRAPASADPDVPLLLDDWLDGTGTTPDEAFKGLRSMGGSGSGSSMAGMDMGSMPGMDMGSSGTDPNNPLGTDTADLTYPAYLVNGRTPDAPAVYPVAAGQQVRLRLINAAAATPFRVAFGAGQMTVVATDGYPVTPVQTDSLLIGMGERYDVLVTAPATGTAALVAAAEGKSGQAMAVLRTGDGPLPSADVRPTGLQAAPLPYSSLRATPAVALPDAKPDVSYTVGLTGDMMSYNWGLNVPKSRGATLPVKQGQRVRLVLKNDTTMWHPMHLHGHTAQLLTDSGPGPRKDTVVVPPKSTVTLEFVADNPGQWLLHC